MVRIDEACAALEAAAPLGLAQRWDNVGVLVDAPADGTVDRALLCIDLTGPVWAEAVRLGAQLVVAYHPIVFGGWKRLRNANPQQATVLDAVRRGVAIYSPHTALDAAVGGMSDWLLDAVGPTTDRAPIEPDLEQPDAGAGRVGTLAEPSSLDGRLAGIKAHLGLSHVRIARGLGDRPIRRVAVCPGAGGALFEGVADVDLLLTGEMKHHDVLARAAAGTHVVLTDHTNTERGFLPRWAEQLAAAVPAVQWTVSTVDADPLEVR